MLHILSQRFLILAAALAGFVAFAAPAQAQMAPCNGSPGERIVWIQPPSNGIGQVYYCTIDAPPPQRQPDRAVNWSEREAPAPEPMIENVVAVIGHADSKAVWIAKNYRTKRDAEKSALAICKQMMGEGCETYISGANGWVILGQDTFGEIIINSGETRAEAESNFKKGCPTCTVNQVLDSANYKDTAAEIAAHEPDIIAPSGNFRRSYAAVAWPTTSLPGKWLDSIWIKGGFPTARAAQEAVISLCARDSGASCTAARTVNSGAMVVAFDSGRNVRVNIGSSVAAAPEEQQKRCAEASVSCVITLAYDVTRNDAVVQDVRAEAFRVSGGKFSAAALVKPPAR